MPLATVLDIKRSIRTLKDLPTVAGIHLKLIRLLNKDNISIHELADIIRHDQSLAARLIGVANSPFFGYPGKINGIEQALLMLGLDLAKSISLGISIFRSLGLDKGTLKHMWSHAYSVALLSEILCTKTPVANSHLCFLGGLLHDIGRVVLMKVFKDQYTHESVQHLHTLRDESLVQAEIGMFSCSHEQAGEWFLENLSFPREIVETVAHHHTFGRIREHEEISTISYLAEGLIHCIAPGINDDGQWTAEHERLFGELGLTAAHIEEFGVLLEEERSHIDSYFEF